MHPGLPPLSQRLDLFGRAQGPKATAAAGPAEPGAAARAACLIDQGLADGFLEKADAQNAASSQ